MIENPRGKDMMMVNSTVNNDIADMTNTQLANQNFLYENEYRKEKLR